MKSGNETILWVDLTRSRRGIPTPGVVKQFAVYQVHNTELIDSAIRNVEPLVACFEYDYPDDEGLDALAVVKRLHPALPVLVISTRYSDAIAFSAARALVWDYIVKPYIGPMADTLRAVIAISRRGSDPCRVSQGESHLGGVSTAVKS
jgi:two-component system, response regulator YesN